MCGQTNLNEVVQDPVQVARVANRRRKMSSGALKTLINELISTGPTTAKGHYSIDTYVRDKGTSYLRLQKRPDGPTIVIGYRSRTLKEKKRELATSHYECLAIL